jgi:hypothetical protein
MYCTSQLFGLAFGSLLAKESRYGDEDNVDPEVSQVIVSKSNLFFPEQIPFVNLIVVEEIFASTNDTKRYVLIP